MLCVPWLVFSPSARTCSLERSSGYALRSRARPEAENPAPSCTLEKSARPLGIVEDWRVDCRVRWLFRRFRFGPQSGSLITFPVPALRTGRAVFPHLGSPVGSCVSHTGPRSHPWTTPMGLALVPDSIHCRSRVAARPVDALTTPSSSDDPFTFACDASGVSGPLPGFQAFATPGTLPPSVTAPHLRPLPSTGITRLLQYYEPLRHPAGPASPSRGPGSVCASPPTGLPMLLPSSPSMRASVTTPADPEGCPCRSLPPPSSAFPISQVGRLPHCPFRGLLNVHSRSGPHVR